eukprot:7384855-Prymnesium_polylepis.1
MWGGRRLGRRWCLARARDETAERGARRVSRGGGGAPERASGPAELRHRPLRRWRPVRVRWAAWGCRPSACLCRARWVLGRCRR